MRYIWLFFFLSASLLAGDSPLSSASAYPKGCQYSKLQNLTSMGEYRAAIELLDIVLSKIPSGKERAFLLVEKAKLLFVNQQQFEAQETFLEALENSSAIHERESEQESACVQELLPVYEASISSPEALQKLIDEATSHLSRHPNCVAVGFYVALGYANKGQFVPFFDRFFQAWVRRSDNFLAWKARGVLHLRLYEAATNESKRNFHRQQAVICLSEAFIRQPQDVSLLLKLLFILPPQERGEFLRKVVDQLVLVKNPPRRTECFCFIEQAIDLGAVTQAKRLIDKAREWYPYSRALNELSDKLEQVPETSR
jgi:tetratricopeptide (TPR) repeat protein